MKKEFEIDIKLPEPIATVKFDAKFPGTYKVEVQPNGSWSVEAPVIGAYINPNDCGEIGGWDIPENEDIPSNVDGTEQANEYVNVRSTVYKVYEVGKDCRVNGRLLKTFNKKDSAEKFMEQSIYRYMREVPCIYERRL